jgi:hypothetical protein
MRQRSIVVAAVATVLTIAVSPSSAALGQSQSGGKVKVVIAGTNDRSDVTDGSLAGKGTFKATGAITDQGVVLGYRTVKGDPSSVAGALITLRFVTKGTKGTITYVVKIDTKVGTSKWTIASATKAYKGLHGKGTETENRGFTVSTLKGTVSR